MARSWHDIFAKSEVLVGIRAFDPNLPWANDAGLLMALKRTPTGERCWDVSRNYLSQFEVEVSPRGDMSYRNPISSWLRYGNLALPMSLLGNLQDRSQRQRGSVSFEKVEYRIAAESDSDSASEQ